MSIINSFAKVDFELYHYRYPLAKSIHEAGNKLARPGIKLWGGRKIGKWDTSTETFGIDRKIKPTSRKNWLNTALKTIYCAITTFLAICLKCVAYTLDGQIRREYKTRLIPQMRFHHWANLPVNKRPRLVTNDVSQDNLYFKLICKSGLDFNSVKPELKAMIDRQPLHSDPYNLGLFYGDIDRTVHPPMRKRYDPKQGFFDECTKFQGKQLIWLVETIASIPTENYDRYIQTVEFLHLLRWNRNFVDNGPEIRDLILHICKKIGDAKAAVFFQNYFRNVNNVLVSCSQDEYFTYEKKLQAFKNHTGFTFLMARSDLSELRKKDPNSLTIDDAVAVWHIADHKLRHSVMQNVKNNLRGQQPPSTGYIDLAFLIRFHLSDQSVRDVMQNKLMLGYFVKTLDLFSVTDPLHREVFRSFLNEFDVGLLGQLTGILNNNDYFYNYLKILSVSSEERYQLIFDEFLHLLQTVNVKFLYLKEWVNFPHIYSWKLLNAIKEQHPMLWKDIMAEAASELLPGNNTIYDSLSTVLLFWKQYSNSPNLLINDLPEPKEVPDLSFGIPYEQFMTTISDNPKVQLLQWIIAMLQNEPPQRQMSLSQCIIDASAAHYIQTGENLLEGNNIPGIDDKLNTAVEKKDTFW